MAKSVATSKSSTNMWLSVTLITITLIVTLLGVSQDLLPEKKIPYWLIVLTASLTGSTGLLQAYQDYRGIDFNKTADNLSAGIPETSQAPKKPLTTEEEQLYASLKEEADQFRSSQIKLFFSPSLSSESLYRLGRLAFNQRDFAEAEKNLKYALELDENNVDAFNLLLQLYQSRAMMRLDHRDYQQAEIYLREAERLITESPVDGDLETTTLLGYLNKSLGQVYATTDPALSEQYWQQAGTIFERVLVRSPDNPNALNGLGNVLDHQGDFSAALEKHQAALKQVPHYTAAANDAALVCEALMKQESENFNAWRQKAIEYWGLALELSANDPQFDESYQQSVRQRIQSLQVFPSSSLERR